MKRCIALLTHFYPPEACAAANRAASLAAALTNAGNDVTVVTNFASFPSGHVDPNDARKRLDEQWVEGTRVVRLHTRVFRGWPAARFLQWGFSALAASAFAIATRRSFDVIVVTMPPITLALPAMLAASRQRAKLVVDVRDVFPDIAIAMGEWKEDGLLARATEVVARTLYRRADLITAVTDTALRQIAARGIPPARLLLAPNGTDLPELFDTNAGRTDGRFTAIYAGNLGLASDIDTILDAAKLLRAESQIAIRLVGDGVEGPRLRNRIAAEGLTNVTVTGSVSRTEAVRMMAAADIALVTLRKGIKESIPTKIYDAFAVGCPVLVSAEGEASAIVVASGGGLTVAPGNPRALAGALVQFAALDRGERMRIGACGHAYVDRHYRRDSIMNEYSQRIAELQGAL